MCVIIHKPAGVKMPDHNTLAECFRANPDGAGFMYPHKGAVRVRKGFMRLTDLQKALDAIPTDATDTPVVIHFRIGTQGHNNPANTHPFIVTDDPKILNAPSARGAFAIAHNGIIPLTTTWRGKSDTKEQHSDTYYFVRDYAPLIVDSAQWHTDPHKVALLEALAESKLSIMNADGTVTNIGRFEQHDDGCTYSNLYHLIPPSYAHGGGWKWSSDTHSLSLSIGGAGDTTYDEQSDTLLSTRRILARFVESDEWLYDAATGVMLSGDAALFATDARGTVYEYIDDLDALVTYDEAYTVTDEAGTPIPFVTTDAFMMRAVIDATSNEHDEGYANVLTDDDYREGRYVG